LSPEVIEILEWLERPRKGRAMSLPHRDSVIWTAGMIGGAVSRSPATGTEFPWIPPAAQNWIELDRVSLFGFSAKMATSHAPEPPQ
jgi:hypothetical protein